MKRFVFGVNFLQFVLGANAHACCDAKNNEQKADQRADYDIGDSEASRSGLRVGRQCFALCNGGVEAILSKVNAQVNGRRRHQLKLEEEARIVEPKTKIE